MLKIGVHGRQPLLVETGLETKKKLATVLVAMDGSLTSLTAATVAMDIFGKAPVEVKGIYVIDHRLITNPYIDFKRELGFAAQPDSSEELVDLFQHKGDLALQWLEDFCRPAHIPVSADIFFGGVSAMVLDQAKQAQMLVLGKRGVGHDDDYEHLGRNYQSIAHHADLPLLIGGCQHRSIERILLAYDNSARSNRALAWATSIQQILLCQLVVVTVEHDSRPNQALLTAIREQIDRSRPYKYQLISRIGQPAEEITAVAAEEQADLIIMGRHRHAAWLERLIGSTVDNTLRNTELPVLLA